MRRGARKERLQPLEVLLAGAMPPSYGERIKIQKAISKWKEIVGPQLGERSAPFDLENGQLLVIAENPLVANRLSMMGGSIMRAFMEGWRLEVKKVKVVVGRLPLAASPSTTPSAIRRARPTEVRVNEEDVQNLAENYREQTPDLPEDAVQALARLKLFLEKRFPQGRRP